MAIGFPRDGSTKRESATGHRLQDYRAHQLTNLPLQRRGRDRGPGNCKYEEREGIRRISKPGRQNDCWCLSSCLWVGCDPCPWHFSLPSSAITVNYLLIQFNFPTYHRLYAVEWSLCLSFFNVSWPSGARFLFLIRQMYSYLISFLSLPLPYIGPLFHLILFVCSFGSLYRILLEPFWAFLPLGPLVISHLNPFFQHSPIVKICNRLSTLQLFRWISLFALDNFLNFSLLLFPLSRANFILMIQIHFTSIASEFDPVSVCPKKVSWESRLS